MRFGQKLQKNDLFLKKKTLPLSQLNFSVLIIAYVWMWRLTVQLFWINCDEKKEDEEKEETKKSLKHSETSGGCLPACLHFWHQTIFCVSKLKTLRGLLVLWRSRICQFWLSSNWLKHRDIVCHDRFFSHFLIKTEGSQHEDSN